jgi:hypothetical protein
MTETPRFLRLVSRRSYAVLALLGLLLWLPGIFSLPPLDRDESRFSQATRQMVQSGDLVDIRFGQVPRYKKPAGIYWLQAAATGIADQFPGVDDHRHLRRHSGEGRSGQCRPPRPGDRRRPEGCGAA